MTVEDGVDSIQDVLSSEEPEHVRRLLRCLDKHLGDLPCRAEVMESLKELANNAEDADIQDAAARLVRRWK